MPLNVHVRNSTEHLLCEAQFVRVVDVQQYQKGFQTDSSRERIRV